MAIFLPSKLYHADCCVHYSRFCPCNYTTTTDKYLLLRLNAEFFLHRSWTFRGCEGKPLHYVVTLLSKATSPVEKFPVFSFCVCGGEVIRGFFFFFSGPDAGALMRDIWHDFLRISCHVGRERVKANWSTSGAPHKSSTIGTALGYIFHSPPLSLPSLSEKCCTL